MKLFSFFCFIILLLTCSTSRDPGLKVDLTGSWRIRLRDNIQYADPEFDDSDWDHIRVPATWEDEGFPGYDGYVWYRKEFRLSKREIEITYILDLGLIHDVDEVYINGHYLNSTGQFPPHLKQVLNERRLYPLNPDHLSTS